MDIFDSGSDDDVRMMCSSLIRDRSIELIGKMIMNNNRFFDVSRDLLFEEFSNGNDVLVKISDKIITNIDDEHFEQFKPLSGNIIRASDLCSIFDKIWARMSNGDSVCFGIYIIAPNHKMYQVIIVVKLLIKDNIKKINVYDNSSFEDNFSIEKLNLEQDPADIYTEDPSDHIVLREGGFLPIVGYIEKCYIIVMMEPPRI